MTNSDYLLKAAIKKVTEKLNELVVEKIEEAANIAQDAPEIIIKELDNLKESIIEEALRMEKEINKNKNTETSTSNQDPIVNEAIKEMQEIKEKIEQINIKMNNLN
tara:strand:- start:1278 stop:1595 length:318 start_codon:yes stop_codon:yes gene_type:complete